MAEYIERKRAIVDACNSLELYGYEYAKLEDALNKISAADVVPVVRCRDCKYRFRNNGHDKNGCPITDADIWMDDNSFCSYGERKEGDE